MRCLANQRCSQGKLELVIVGVELFLCRAYKIRYNSFRSTRWLPAVPDDTSSERQNCWLLVAEVPFMLSSLHHLHASEPREILKEHSERRRGSTPTGMNTSPSDRLTFQVWHQSYWTDFKNIIILTDILVLATGAVNKCWRWCCKGRKGKLWTRNEK